MIVARLRSGAHAVLNPVLGSKTCFPSCACSCQHLSTVVAASLIGRPTPACGERLSGNSIKASYPKTSGDCRRCAPEVIQNDFDSFTAELLLEGILEGITALTEYIEN